MRNLLAAVLASLLAVACQGNPVAPRTPRPSAPETPAAPVPAAPKAVLSIGGGELSPPLGIRDFTQMLFDGSRSTGEGLTYLLEFGDGASSAEPVARHRSESSGPLDARLTVTDTYGRTDSTTETYYQHPVANVSATWWRNQVQTGRRTVQRTLVLAQDGATLSGSYAGPEGNKRVIGALSDDRAIRLRTQDGAIELIGALNWKSREELGAVLRLFVRGGMADGTVLDFEFRDPY